MHPDEHAKMRTTGRVQERGGGQTRVADPPDPNTYRAAPKGDEYVEFDVRADRVLPFGRGQGRIEGPNSPAAKLARLKGEDTTRFEMPYATNIEHKGTKR